MSSKTTLSIRTESVSVEKYDMRVEIETLIETRPEWDLVFRNAANDAISREDAQALIKEQKRVNIDWEKTGKTIEFTSIKRCKFYDTELCLEGRPLSVFIVPDGPVLGIATELDKDSVTLLDPCHVVFDGKQRIHYVPIFGVERTTLLNGNAIKMSQPPSAVLVEGYLGFVIQNRMFKYALRPKVPFSETAELESESDKTDELLTVVSE